jgi:hypothetical protein
MKKNCVKNLGDFIKSDTVGHLVEYRKKGMTGGICEDFQIENLIHLRLIVN